MGDRWLQDGVQRRRGALHGSLLLFDLQLLSFFLRLCFRHGERAHGCLLAHTRHDARAEDHAGMDGVGFDALGLELLGKRKGEEDVCSLGLAVCKPWIIWFAVLSMAYGGLVT